MKKKVNFLIIIYLLFFSIGLIASVKKDNCYDEKINRGEEVILITLIKNK